MLLKELMLKSAQKGMMTVIIERSSNNSPEKAYSLNPECRFVHKEITHKSQLEDYMHTLSHQPVQVPIEPKPALRNIKRRIRQVSQRLYKADRVGR